jgi:hypothetical protein
MLNVDSEISQLKSKLTMAGYPNELVNEMAEEASSLINKMIDDSVSEAYNAAAEMGYVSGLDEFVKELRVMKMGNSFKIWTESGSTDFSDPPFPMLPKLLKNANIAKDGTKFKVIPIRDRGAMVMTSDQVTREMNAERQSISKARENKPYAQGDRPANFLEMYSTQKARVDRKRQFEKQTGAVSFRTASSKQDANTQWVHPAKQADMAGVLNDINRDLEKQIDEIVSFVVSRYEV